MRHADHDLLHAERAAALDDLLERRNHRFAAVEAEAFGAGEFQVAEFLEAFGLDQLVEDGALAGAGEGDFLVGTLDALLDPALLCAVGNVQELDAQRLAIGPPQDGDDLADGAELQAEHLVEKDRAIEVGVAEPVGVRIELAFAVLRLQIKRIEVGVKMPAGAVGANEHQRTHRVARRPFDIGVGKLDALALRLRLDLGADRLADLAPVASSAAVRSLRSRTGQSDRRQDGPCAASITFRESSFRLWKNDCHSALTALGSAS